MNFKNLKIGTKLTVGFGLITLILIILGVTQFVKLQTLSYDQNDLIESFDMADHMMEAKMNLAVEKQVVMEMIAAADMNELNEWWGVHEEEVDMFDENTQELIARTDDKSWGIMHEDDKAEIHRGITAMDKDHDELILVTFEQMKMIKTERLGLHDSLEVTALEEQLTALDLKLDANLDRVIEELEILEVLVTTIVDETKEASVEETNMAKTQLAILIILGVILSIVFTVVIIRSITGPIKKAVDMTQKIAQGDLTAVTDVKQNDEVGQLVAYLENMAEKLKDIVSNIMAGADNIASSSIELSSTSQQISQGASEQASSAEEVSSSMEEMSSNIQQNTDNAMQTEKISANAASGMNNVATSAQESLVSVREITEKINIINDIAFQTNILALNAAVEAARAGEHGRGFAVVAAEVRKLAERSKIASDEIVSLSQTSRKVTEESGEMMQKILPDIDKTSKLVQEISAASQEQNSGADQVNSAIQQLNQVTQQNAAASEEMATSSEELSSQAEQLKSLISYFNIGGDQKRSYVQKAYNAPKQTKKAQAQKQKLSTYEPKGVDLKMTNDTSDAEYEKF